MSDEELLARFKEYKARVGPAKAISELTARGISPSTADCLSRDDYDRKPRKKLRAALVDIVVAKAS